MQIGYRHGTEHVAVLVHRDAPGRFTVTVNGQPFGIEAAVLDETTVQLQLELGGAPQAVVAHVARIGGETHVAIGGEVYVLASESASAATEHAHAPPQIVAPMPGKVLQVLVADGEHVEPGTGLLILEAMKMEHRITAPAAAHVKLVHVRAGEMVDGGAPLVDLVYDAAD